MTHPIRIAAILLAMAATPVLAQDGPSLADLGSDAALAADFDKMAQGASIPDWVRGAAVTTPAQTAQFDGKDWQVMSACKQHDCGAHQIAVIRSADGAMHGVLSELAEDGSSQTLTWLNMTGGAETIDGRTVLFAALSGSLANHPEAFNYPE